MNVQVRISQTSLRDGHDECICSLVLDSKRGRRMVLHFIGTTLFEAISGALKAGRRTLAKAVEKNAPNVTRSARSCEVLLEGIS